MYTENDDVQAQADRISQALRELKPNQKQLKQELFTRLYPVIIERISANVTQKEILALLVTHGLKLHPSRFKELMAAEAKKVASVPEHTREEKE